MHFLFILNIDAGIAACARVLFQLLKSRSEPNLVRT